MKKNISELLGEANPIKRFPLLHQAALDEFSQRKFEEASLNDMLKKAGMSKGSFYYHFGDKYGLYICTIDTIVKKKIAFFSPLLQQYTDSDFFEFFRELVRLTVEFMLQDNRISDLMERGLEESEDFKARLYKLYPYDFEQSFGPLINTAMQKGQISSRFPAEFVAKVFEVMLFNAPKFVSESASTDAIVKMIDRIIDILQFGVSAEGG